MSKSIRIALIQTRASPSPAENRKAAIHSIRAAAASGARIICLQELFASRYFCQTADPAAFELAEPIPGPTIEALSTVARETGTVLIVPLFERRAPGLFHNSAAVLDADGSLLGVYRKMHIPDDPQFHEKYYFSPGDAGFAAWETRYGKIGVCICWDQWFPEAARITALKGAEILFFPTAIGWLPEDKEAGLGDRQVNAWETIQRSHSIANGVFVAAVNRIGFEENPGGDTGIEFWGRSFVAGPDGEIIAQAGESEPEILLADLDPSAIERQRIGWPFLRDRRGDAYGAIGEKFDDGNSSSNPVAPPTQPS